jgi:hypothetical protein
MGARGGLVIDATRSASARAAGVREVSPESRTSMGDWRRVC